MRIIQELEYCVIKQTHTDRNEDLTGSIPRHELIKFFFKMTLTYIFGIKRAKGKTLKVQKLHTKFKY